MTIARYGFDINQPGASSYPRIAINQPSPYKNGLVIDVIANETHPEYAADGSNIGFIKVRLIPADQNESESNLNWVRPLETNIQEYPLKDEIVMVILTASKLYYSRRINMTNNITQGYGTDISLRYAPTPASGVPSSENAQLAASGVRTGDLNGPVEVGSNIVLGAGVLPLRSSDGDLIFQGRFGNSIRMGSNLFSNPTVSVPQPNVLITAGQWEAPTEVSTKTKSNYSLTYENINKDKNSIWLIVNEKVPFLASTTATTSNQKAHLRSSSTQTEEYTGTQMFLNSDRLILNSKKSEISLFANTQINLSSLKEITIDSETFIGITANNTVSISSPKIFIGSGNASEPMVLGNKLAEFLDELLGIFTNSPFAVTTSTGPAPLFPSIKQQLNILKNKLAEPTFNSKDNFTTETNAIVVNNTQQGQLIQKQTVDATRAERPFTLRRNLANRSST